MKKSKKIIFILTLMGMLFSSTTVFADGWKTWNSNDFKKAWEAYAHGSNWYYTK